MLAGGACETETGTQETLLSASTASPHLGTSRRFFLLIDTPNLMSAFARNAVPEAADSAKSFSFAPPVFGPSH
jgi:hypothetical protein